MNPYILRCMNISMLEHFNAKFSEGYNDIRIGIEEQEIGLIIVIYGNTTFDDRYRKDMGTNVLVKESVLYCDMEQGLEVICKTC